MDTCGHTNPNDLSICNLKDGHSGDHMLLGPVVVEDDESYQVVCGQWYQDDVLTCDHCGYPLTKYGMCGAPMSVAD
jgi:hypothetical protein